MKKVVKPIAALATVAGALVFTYVFPPNGLDIDIDPSPRAQAHAEREPYDLTELQVLNRAILEVNDHYVDPGRVNHRRMFLAGLNSIQRSVAPVIVHYEDEAAQLSVQVAGDTHEFRVDDVDSPWKLASRFRDVFAFLQTNLDGEDVELRDVEYAAVNGMLRTLDPHTILLTPDVFEEMQMNTRGEFGGLGIVISIRDGHLTILRPMPNTPASRAGLQRGDRIVKINDESTLNMPLSEAVDRLRGPPGSRVAVYVKRRRDNGEYGREEQVDLVRAVIHIDSVESKMLADNIGYVKINSFQGNTHEDMRRALATLHEGNMRGLVLDMRGNPGGLLEQAVRVADTFLTSGSIVATSSNDPRQRDEKFASADGTEPNYPIVCLVNGASASASEIVAGALKNHDRALVVGTQSFGKGSVQVLYNFQDGSALKLTIAQYLTPGDVSIQGVGIVPDIAIEPMTVEREDMDLTVDQLYLRESDLRSHLTSERARQSARPSTVLRYYLSTETRRRLREAGPNDREENEQESEFLTDFSRSLLARVAENRVGRRQMLEDAQAVIAQTRGEQMARAERELSSLGVDWDAGTDQGATTFNVELSTNHSDNTVTAGEDFSLRVRVTNTGEHPVFRLRAKTKSDNQLFEGRELVFGKLAPGETREWVTTLGTCSTEEEQRVCRVPRDTPNRADIIKLEFEEEHGHAPEAQQIRTIVRSLDRPQFAYAVQVADSVTGNGDGAVSRGETAAVYLRVKNVGTGRTYGTQASLRNLSGRGVLLRDGRFRIDNIPPGEERLVRFSFEVLNDFEPDEAKLEVSVYDLQLRESVTQKVIIPLVRSTAQVGAMTGNASVNDGAQLRVAPTPDAPIMARVAGGAFPVTREAQVGEFVRVDLGEGRPGWARASDLGTGQGGHLDWTLNLMPPRIEVTSGHDTLVTRESSMRLRGRASDDTRVRDIYVFAGARKVHYQSNAQASDPTSANFDVEVPLHGGINYVTVFVRESDDVLSRKMFVIRRDAADGSAMETPRFDNDVLGGNVHQ